MKNVATGEQAPKTGPMSGKAAAGEYMNPAQVAYFREMLTDWKQALMEEVERTVHHMQDEASNFPPQ